MFSTCYSDELSILNCYMVALVDQKDPAKLTFRWLQTNHGLWNQFRERFKPYIYIREEFPVCQANASSSRLKETLHTNLIAMVKNSGRCVCGFMMYLVEGDVLISTCYDKNEVRQYILWLGSLSLGFSVLDS